MLTRRSLFSAVAGLFAGAVLPEPAGRKPPASDDCCQSLMKTIAAHRRQLNRDVFRLRKGIASSKVAREIVGFGAAIARIHKHDDFLRQSLQKLLESRGET